MCDKKVPMNELIIKKQKHKEALRQHYIKYMASPYTKEPMFDPAIQRFMSMHATMGDNFRATRRTSVAGLAVFVVPFAALYYLFYCNITKNEAEIANGEVAYKDRWFKFI